MMISIEHVKKPIKNQKIKEKVKRMNKRQAKKIRKNMIKNGYIIYQSNELNWGRKMYIKFNVLFNKNKIYPLHFVKKCIDDISYI